MYCNDSMSLRGGREAGALEKEDGGINGGLLETITYGYVRTSIGDRR